MATIVATENQGTVRLGEVEAPAIWSIGQGDCLVIRFQPLSLSGEQARLLENYRHTSAPVMIKLPGERRAKPSAVIGFDRANVTFYISRSTGNVSRSHSGQESATDN